MKKQILYLFPLSFLMSSCRVYNTGNISSGPLLSVRDTYVDIASGTCKSFAVFGIGCMHKKNMILQARSDLYRKRPLKPGEYYSNFSIDFTKTFVFMVYLSRAVVSADILRSADTSVAPFSPGFKQALSRDSLLKVSAQALPDTRGNLKMMLSGDTVYYSRDNKNYTMYKVSDIEKGNVMLLAINLKDQNTLASGDGLFFNTKEVADGFRAGGRVKAELINEYNTTVYEDGFIVGVASGTVLVKTKSGLHALSTFRCRKLD